MVPMRNYSILYDPLLFAKILMLQFEFCQVEGKF